MVLRAGWWAWCEGCADEVSSPKRDSLICFPATPRISVVRLLQHLSILYTSTFYLVHFYLVHSTQAALVCKSSSIHMVLYTVYSETDNACLRKWGKTIAEQLCRLCTPGAKVVIAARRLAACEAVATEINGKG